MARCVKSLITYIHNGLISWLKNNRQLPAVHLLSLPEKKKYLKTLLPHHYALITCLSVFVSVYTPPILAYLSQHCLCKSHALALGTQWASRKGLCCFPISLWLSTAFNRRPFGWLTDRVWETELKNKQINQPLPAQCSSKCPSVSLMGSTRHKFKKRRGGGGFCFFLDWQERKKTSKKKSTEIGRFCKTPDSIPCQHFTVWLNTKLEPDWCGNF